MMPSKFVNLNEATTCQIWTWKSEYSGLEDEQTFPFDSHILGQTLGIKH